MNKPCTVSDIEALEISSERRAEALARIAEDGNCNRASCPDCPGSSDGKASSCTLRTFGGEIPTGNHAPLPGEIRAAMEARVARYRRESSRVTQEKQKEPVDRWLTPADIEALPIRTKEHLKALETIYYRRNCDAVLRCLDCPFTSGNSADQCRLRNEDGDIPVGSHKPLSPELIAAIGKRFSHVIIAGLDRPKEPVNVMAMDDVAEPKPYRDRLTRPAPFGRFHLETEQGALGRKVRLENPRLKAATAEAIDEAAMARGIARDILQGIRCLRATRNNPEPCPFASKSCSCLANGKNEPPTQTCGGLSEQGKALVLRYLRSGALPGDSPEAAAEF